MVRTYLGRIKKQSLKGMYGVYDFFAGTEKRTEYTHFVNGFENPNYHFQKDEIGFIHLPKTAGTSFSKLLANDPQNRFALLKIHRPVSPHCPPTEYRYITVMRDPIDRVWSLYKMVLRDPSGLLYQKQAQESLEVFLQVNRSARNLICRYLSGEIEAEPNAATVEKAWQHLQQFYRVISFENFAEEASFFLEEHGVPFEKIPNERKSKYEGPTAEERAIIVHYNQHDVQLFERWKANH